MFVTSRVALVPVTLPVGETVPVGVATRVAVKEVTVEPVANEPVPVATTTGASKGNVLVTLPPIALNWMLPLTNEVALPPVPA